MFVAAGFLIWLSILRLFGEVLVKHRSVLQAADWMLFRYRNTQLHPGYEFMSNAAYNARWRPSLVGRVLNCAI